MAMLRIWILLFVTMLSGSMYADNEQLLEKLDSAIENRAQYVAEREKRISRLKKEMNATENVDKQLEIVDQLYDEYHVFRFDSAVAYARKGLRLAQEYGDPNFIQLFTIYRAETLATGGLYSEAEGNLKLLDPQSMDRQIAFKYYMTGYKVYSYWSQNSQDTSLADRYRQEAVENLRTGIIYLNKSNPFYNYYQGEYHTYVEPDTMKARRYYQDVLWRATPNSHLYALASYALANSYLIVDGDEQMYEEHLIHAALADVRSCTMETEALLMLAVRLFEKGDAEVERAERYINASMEDAMLYNNRLRIMKTAQVLPQIITASQAMSKKQNIWLILSVSIIVLLVVAVLYVIYYTHRQKQKFASRQKTQYNGNAQVEKLNRQLADSRQQQVELNGQLQEMNGQLQEMNQRIVDSDKRGTRLASVYIDLCTKYIDRLGRYHTMVKQKVKAHQEQELLQAFSTPRIPEDDAATFLNRFDKAFLELYPTFVDDFNALLRPGEQLPQKSPNVLTTELRTFALIRLGVKNTADIAGLLFLSNQTIYNCRSVIRNKAINKETFTDDVMHLCQGKGL